MKDFLGRQIEVGSVIAWPGRQGSSLWMSVGRVTDITHKTKWTYAGEGSVAVIHASVIKAPFVKPGKKVRIEAIHRVVVVG